MTEEDIDEEVEEEEEPEEYYGDEFEEIEDEEIDMEKDKGVWLNQEDEKVINIFHTQSDDIRKSLISSIERYNNWVKSREGLRELPHVRMSLENNLKIRTLINCLMKELRMALKIKDNSIKALKLELQKLETKKNKKIKTLEDRVERLREKSKKGLKSNQLAVCKRIEKGEKQVDLARELRVTENTINNWWKIYKTTKKLDLSKKSDKKFKIPKNTKKTE